MTASGGGMGRFETGLTFVTVIGDHCSWKQLFIVFTILTIFIIGKFRRQKGYVTISSQPIDWLQQLQLVLLFLTLLQKDYEFVVNLFMQKVTNTKRQNITRVRRTYLIKIFSKVPLILLGSFSWVCPTVILHWWYIKITRNSIFWEISWYWFEALLLF